MKPDPTPTTSPLPARTRHPKNPALCAALGASGKSVLGLAAEVGRSPSQLHALLIGRSATTPVTAARIAAALGTTVAALGLRVNAAHWQARKAV